MTMNASDRTMTEIMISLTSLVLNLFCWPGVMFLIFSE